METGENKIVVKDSSGNILKEGDSLMTIRDVKVKGGTSVIKKGSILRSIRFTSNVIEVEGRIEKEIMVLKTTYLKKL